MVKVAAKNILHSHSVSSLAFMYTDTDTKVMNIQEHLVVVWWCITL